MLLGLFNTIANAIGKAIAAVVGTIVEPILNIFVGLILKSLIIPLMNLIAGSASLLLEPTKLLIQMLVGFILEISDFLFKEWGWKEAMAKAIVDYALIIFNAISEGPIISMLKWTPINYFDSGKSNVTTGVINPYFLSIKLMKDGVMPTAMVIFALIVMVELFQITVRTEGMRNSGFESPFKLMLKVAICKILLDNTQMVLEAIFNMATDLLIKLQSVAGSISVVEFDKKNKMVEQIMEAKWYGILFLALQMSFQCALIKLVMLVIPFIVFGRVMEMYIYIVLAPIPFATFASQELSQIGKTFIKQFLSLSLRVVVMYIIILVFSMMMIRLIFGDVKDVSIALTTLIANAFGGANVISFVALGELAVDFGVKPLIFAIMLLMSLMGAERYTKAITGAFY